MRSCSTSYRRQHKSY